MSDTSAIWKNKLTHQILNHKLILLLLKINLETKIYHHLSPFYSHWHAGIKKLDLDLFALCVIN